MRGFIHTRLRRNCMGSKYDIRDWAPDHEKMGKGVTLTAEEAVALRELLQEQSL